MQHGGAVTDAYTLMGDPGYWDKQNAYDLYGLGPPGGVRAAGQSLPLTEAAMGDHMAQWWHPHSPTFWGALLIGATGLLILGASFRVRAGVGKETATAGASVGHGKGE